MDIKSTIKRHVTRFRYPKSYRKYGASLANPVGELIYQDNGGSILAVGHLDHVIWGTKPAITNEGVYNCPQLDDRLGVAIITELLPLFVDEPVDILLTDCEEIGQSTASFFNPTDKQYRWVIEFDRLGSDTVFYQYGGDSLEDTVARCGVECGWGSFTDICNLEQLGCQMMNWGCGYHDQHTNGCYCEFAEVETQLVKFQQWYKYFGHGVYKWSPPQPKRLKRREIKVSDNFWRDLVTCDVCGEDGNDTSDVRCINCASVMEGFRDGQLS